MGRVINQGYWVQNVSTVTSKYIVVHDQPRSPGENIPGPCGEFEGDIICPAEGIASNIITFGQNTQDLGGNFLDLIFISSEQPEFVPRYNVFNCPSGSTKKEM